jgi:phage-related tail fiber protein
MSWQAISLWIEGHPGLASWVQAFGSIAAIFLAVFIASRDSRLRRKAEAAARLGAIDRAMIAINDAGMRVSTALLTLARKGVHRELMEMIATDLSQSQQHLKEALSIQGVDAAIYSQIFMARTAVESAGHTFRVLAGISDSDEYTLQTAKKALEEIMTAYDNLNLLKLSV